MWASRALAPWTSIGENTRCLQIYPGGGAGGETVGLAHAPFTALPKGLTYKVRYVGMCMHAGADSTLPVRVFFFPLLLLLLLLHPLLLLSLSLFFSVSYRFLSFSRSE